MCLERIKKSNCAELVGCMEGGQKLLWRQHSAQVAYMLRCQAAFSSVSDVTIIVVADRNTTRVMSDMCSASLCRDGSPGSLRRQPICCGRNLLNFQGFR